jgi:stress response protein YsnF
LQPTDQPQQTQDALSIVEEELHVEKRQVATGRVTVRTTTEVSEEVARATLAGESVEVTRVPVNREIDAAPSIRTEGDVTIIPVVEEVIVVEKRLVLKEEIHLRRTVTREDVAVPVKLRKQRATIERDKER